MPRKGGLLADPEIRRGYEEGRLFGEAGAKAARPPGGGADPRDGHGRRAEPLRRSPPRLRPDVRAVLRGRGAVRPRGPLCYRLGGRRGGGGPLPPPPPPPPLGTP